MKLTSNTLLNFNKISTFFILFATLLMQISCLKKNHLNFDKTTVSIALNQYPKTLDPRYSTDANGQRLNQLIFQSLVRFDQNLTLVPDASLHWQFLPKEKTYLFELKPELSFNEDKPVTCEDILFSFKEFQKDSCPFKSSFEKIQKLECQGSQLKIQLKEFSATFLTDLTVFKILPQSEVQKYGDNFYEHILGSGPYHVQKLEFNEIILTKKNNISNNYIKTFQFKIIQDDSTRFLNAYKGSVDIIPSGIPLNKISYLKSQNKYQIYTYPTLSMNYLLPNFKNPILSQKEIREAISLAINVENIIQYKMEGYGEPATSILPPSNPFHNQSLTKITPNLKKAMEIFKKNNIQKLTLKTSNSPDVIEVAKVIAEQLRQAGVELQIQSYEWGTFYGDIKKGQFDLAMMRWVGVSDPDIYRIAFDSREFPPGRNRGFYSNPSLNLLLESGVQIENFEKRKTHYNRVQEIIFDDLAIIPLWYNYQVDLISHRIKNYKPAVNGDYTPLLDIKIEP